MRIIRSVPAVLLAWHMAAAGDYFQIRVVDAAAQKIAGEQPNRSRASGAAPPACVFCIATPCPCGNLRF